MRMSIYKNESRCEADFIVSVVTFSPRFWGIFMLCMSILNLGLLKDETKIKKFYVRHHERVVKGIKVIAVSKE